jgi:MFS family permease
MYVAESTRALLRAEEPARAGKRRLAGVHKTVVLLGLTSLFTDVSAEMVSTILPVYIVFALGGTPLQLGIIDGIYQGAAAVVRVLAGIASDRSGRHKLVAGVGYGISAVCKLAFVGAGGAIAPLIAVIMADRTGKGIRTAPRDAMISLSTRPEALGLAFGVHRAMDTVGAFLGPLVAVGLLLAAPGDYDSVFLVSFLFAAIGLATLVLLVPRDRERRQSPAASAAPAAPRASLRSAAGLVGDRRFRRLIIVSAALSLVTVSDSFLYLALQRRMDFSPPLLPLLFVGTSFAYMLLAVPLGRLADRVGRARVFLGGYALLAAAYASLLQTTIGPLDLAIALLALGAFYAATDGVLAALGSTLLPDELRATGLSVLAAADTGTTLVASVAFGALWTFAGLTTALIVFGAALLVVVAGSAAVLLGPARAGADVR